MKRSISFSISPIANGLIVATASDYSDHEQFYFATQVEAIEALPVVMAEAIARQEEREANEAGEVNAMNRKLGYPIIGESHAQSVQRKQDALNREWRGALDAMAAAPAVVAAGFDDGPTAA